MDTLHNAPPPAPHIPAIGEGKRGAQGHIGYLLRQAHAALRIRMEKALLCTGLTLPQFSTLTMLKAYPGASAAELARLALLTPQTISVIIANLEKAGLITRRAHPEHGRIRSIALTELGHTHLQCARAAVTTAEACLLEGYTPAEEASIRAWLVATAKTIDMPDGARGP